MINVLLNILRHRKNILFLIVCTCILFFFFRVIPQLHIIIDSFQLSSIGLMRKFEILYDYSFGNYSLWDIFETIAISLLSFFTALNGIVFFHYIQRQKKILAKKTIGANIIAMFLGIFGVGCVSCGALIIGPLLSALGILSVLELLPYHGKELMWLGVVFVIISTLYLLKKIQEPLICD